MAGYSPALLDQIRTGVDIVELVGRFVNLKKSGVNWKGLCPFHGEKTPSFMVNPAKGIFHCFGCGVGGDAFGFLMRQDKLTFPEAVRTLAQQTGVALPDDRERSAADSGRDELLRVMDLAARFYEDTLWKSSGERARRYLDERGIAPEIAKRFRLGYAPDAWDGLLTFMRSERVSEDVLVATGLAIQRENRTGVYDRFRGRLLFAIRDLQGRVVAFGGRAFGDEQPKYLNSPETALYSKGQLLYAADAARETMRERQRALVVEGYIDCVMAHQHGFTEAVAALGTSFTAAQLQLLRRYTTDAVLFFDADQAGLKAAERAEALLDINPAGRTWAMNRTGTIEDTGNLRVRVATLPAGHDPDTFLRKEGREAFEQRIAASRSLLSYALDRAIADPEGRGGPRARTQAFARAALLLAKVTDAGEANALAREAGTKLGVEPAQLWIEAEKLHAALAKPAPQRTAAPAAAAGSNRERDLVLFLLHDKPARATLLSHLDPDDVRDVRLRPIFVALRARPDADSESLMTDLPDDESRGLLAALLVDERTIENRDALVEQFEKHLEREQRLKHQRMLARRIAETDADPQATDAVEDQFRALHATSKVVYELAGGVAQSLEHRPEGRQGVQTDGD
jgi:DNA primase